MHSYAGRIALTQLKRTRLGGKNSKTSHFVETDVGARLCFKRRTRMTRCSKTAKAKRNRKLSARFKSFNSRHLNWRAAKSTERRLTMYTKNALQTRRRVFCQHLRFMSSLTSSSFFTSAWKSLHPRFSQYCSLRNIYIQLCHTAVKSQMRYNP